MRETKLWRRRIGMGVLVALIGLLGVADFLPHTDDGCAVEVHCLACRAHMGAVTDLAATLLLQAGAREFVGHVLIEDQGLLEAPARLLPPGRAPPTTA